MSILDILGSIINPVTDLISEIIPDPDKKLKLQTEITKIEFAARDKLLEYEETVINSKTKHFHSIIQPRRTKVPYSFPSIVDTALFLSVRIQ